MTDGSVASYSWSVNGVKVEGADNQDLVLSKTDMRFKMRPTVTCHSGDRTEAMTVVDTASVVDWGKFDCYHTDEGGSRTLTGRGLAKAQARDNIFIDFCALSYSDIDGDLPIIVTTELLSTSPYSLASGFTGTLEDWLILLVGHDLCDAFTPELTMVAGGIHVEIPGYDASYSRITTGECYWPVAIQTHDGAIYQSSVVHGINDAGQAVDVIVRNAVGFSR